MFGSCADLRHTTALKAEIRSGCDVEKMFQGSTSNIKLGVEAERYLQELGVKNELGVDLKEMLES